MGSLTTTVYRTESVRNSDEFYYIILIMSFFPEEKFIVLGKKSESIKQMGRHGADSRPALEPVGV